MTIEFTYSVNWAPTSITFARRFERYLDYNFFEHQASPACCHSHCSVDCPDLSQNNPGVSSACRLYISAS